MVTPLAADTEILLGIKENIIIGFVIYVPIYKDKQIIGYTEKVLKQRKNTPNGLLDFINIEKIQQIKNNQE